MGGAQLDTAPGTDRANEVGQAPPAVAGSDERASAGKTVMIPVCGGHPIECSGWAPA